ncbi:MAG TPA: hypothetical protein PK872_03685 [Ferruginibacter sp.]|nr:hypothetical protein [Ferruginibacter sp.]
MALKVKILKIKGRCLAADFQVLSPGAAVLETRIDAAEELKYRKCP